jgi:hypothetical protein
MGQLPYRRSQLRGAFRAFLVVASLFCLMGQSFIAIGCQVHDIEHCAQGQDCSDTAADSAENGRSKHADDCHPCCGSMSSGHACAHGVMMTGPSLQTGFAPQYVLVLPHAPLRADAQFIPLGTFRPPASV